MIRLKPINLSPVNGAMKILVTVSPTVKGWASEKEQLAGALKRPLGVVSNTTSLKSWDEAAGADKENLLLEALAKENITIEY
jgi:hypothetical protein